MFIRKATVSDLPELHRIYAAARAYMRANGNPNQWGNSFPPEEVLLEGIQADQQYVICDEEGKPHAAFLFLEGKDPTYEVIREGHWLNDEPYGTFHRVGSDGEMKGCFKACLEYCRSKSRNLRADTHEDNKTMQHVLESNGFIRCGYIDTWDGTERIAYHRTE